MIEQVFCFYGLSGGGVIDHVQHFNTIDQIDQSK